MLVMHYFILYINIIIKVGVMKKIKAKVCVTSIYYHLI